MVASKQLCAVRQPSILRMTASYVKQSTEGRIRFHLTVQQKAAIRESAEEDLEGDVRLGGPTKTRRGALSLYIWSTEQYVQRLTHNLQSCPRCAMQSSLQQAGRIEAR